MKTADRINPLTNPVAPGDFVKAGEKLYWADTGIQGDWKIYEGKNLVVDGIWSQMELCAWFHELEQTSSRAAGG